MKDLDENKILSILKSRFENNINRHKDIDWKDVENKLLNNMEKLSILNEMEQSGGEPDLVKYIKETNEYVFFDCSKETPIGRRSLCYDKEGLESRKQFKPENNVIDLANYIGIELLSEEDYHYLQSLGEFDLKTSSWLKTPNEIRKLGGAIYGDRRYNRVFIYHNGADSYYSSRGFRGSLKI